ncbi:IPT/TIG domain-containing protein [Kineosporia sp. J2-2]|uniref:IPT/TIG domain-containing protein n=1 Tax=Kineosporia corallincola TaxID=2835133 RepID=A0ABS5TJZ7_9ACTN|nr:IPT/TIG domain-containing protein [Kineosporia corallincola]MBT0771396.1 IPT/TIG domain-containing protein [Kineosporia corallincola]
MTRTSTNPGGGPLFSGRTRFRHRRGVAQVVAGLLVAGGGLPLAAATATASAAPQANPAHPARTSTAHSAVGKPSSTPGKAQKDKKLGKSDFRAAADGSTAAYAYGVSANVSLLGASAIGTDDTPKSDWPAGPAQATTANVGVTGLLATGTATTTANGDDLKDTATASAAVNGLGTGTGLQGLQAVTADLVQSQCTGTGAGITATSTVTGLKLNGVLNTTVPSNPAPNTVINILGLGTLTLNEQTQSTPATGKTKLATNALHLRLLGGALSAVGQGDVIAGHTECTTTNAVTPTVTSFTPATGPATGGTAVTITGTGFRGASDVKFGANSTQYTIDSPTQITANAPAGSGAVTVSVATSAGTGTSSGNFTYVGAPTVTGLTPSTGPPAGGTTVTIAGTNFVAGSTVRFGSASATNVTVNSPTSITADAPAGTGSQFVTVTNSGGTSAQVQGAVYTYSTPAPTVSSIAPTHGPLAGGTSVTVTGTGFTSQSVVKVDGTARPTTYVSPTEVDFVTPAHAGGNATITVDNGSTSGTGSATFTYGDPNATSMTPTSGPITGGTSVTVSGTDLDQVTSVDVGGTAGTITAQPASGTSLTFTTPANLSVGPATVTLSGPGSSTTSPGAFSYNLIGGVAPLALVMNPTTGPIAGGTQVTIGGLFVGTPTGVEFGGVPGTGFSYTAGTITVNTPPGTAPGDVGVTVLYSGGVTSSVLTSTFTYTAGAPTIGSLNPTGGPLTGGTTVTVTGTNFTAGSIVAVNSIPVPTTYVDGTTLEFTTPPGTRGNAPVTVQTGLLGTPSSPVNFAYVSVPLNAVALPLTGPSAGGTSVTITGLGLDDVTSVDVGGTSVPSSAFTANTATTLTFPTPAHTSGLVTLSLNGPFGTSVLPSLFIYTASAPTVSAISPTNGGLSGGYTVTLTGTGFDSSTAISVGGVAATQVTPNLAGTSVTFRMPAGLVPGAATVTVTTDGGSASTTFTYNTPPTITSLSPITGTAAGGTEVTLTGTGFAGATGVTIGGNSVTGAGFTLVDPTTIRFTTPAHATGPVSVVVTGPNGNSTGTTLFVYTPIPVAPTIGTLTPAVGPVAGGTQVTITGTGFLLTSGVTFGGSAGTGVTVINDNTLVVTTPAHAAGAVNVVVTNPVGGSGTTGSAAFTYVAPNTAPVVDTITPASGPISGGTSLVIKGINLNGVSSVTFGGTAGSNLTLVDNSTVTVTSPAHAAGAVPVVLTNANGSSSAYVFTYVPLTQLPTVSGLTPEVGPVAGGTRVTIGGTGFDANTTVTFDGVAGTDLVLGPDVAGASSSTRSKIGTTSRDDGVKARAYHPVPVSKALKKWKAAASNTLQVTTPPHAGGPTTVVITNSAGSISFVESFTFIPVLAATTTIETDVTISATKAIAPAGPNYSGLRVTACAAPEGLGSTTVSDDGDTCEYSAPDRLGTDSFVMSVIDDLGQTAEQTVNVTIVAEDGGGSTGGGGGNDSGDGDNGDDDGGSGTNGGGGNDSGDGDNGNDGGGGSTTDGGGGNDSGGGLAFTGTPLLLIPGLALGLVLMLIGAGLLGAERFRIRRGGSYGQPVTDEHGRQLMPAGLFGSGPGRRHEAYDHDPAPQHPDDAA